MKTNSLITWMDKVAGQSFASALQTTRDVRVDDVLRAARLLDRKQCALLRLHDIEGRSVDELQERTGWPRGIIEAQIEESRSRFVYLIQAEARRWRERLEALEGDQA